VSLNLLKLNQDDFPDVCVECAQCVKSIRDAIQTHTTAQIRDTDIALAFVEEAMQELLKFLQRREERCQSDGEHEHADGSGHHEHHTHNEHHKLEDGIKNRFADTRRTMLEA